MSDSGPLTGLRVLELGRFIAAPLAGRLLADWGADVIKIEAPEGDPIRWGPGGDRDGYSPVFASYNRSKRSITLDLKEEAGCQVLRSLLSGSDALIHNFRPAALARVGLQPEALLEEAPHLVVCGISGFGLDGPHAERPSFDVMVSGISGLVAQQRGEPGAQPVGPPFADVLTGMSTAQAVLAGLLARTRDTTCSHSGGQSIDVSMLSSVLSATDDAFTTWFEAGSDLGARSRQARQHAFLCETADNCPFVAQVTSSESVWRDFVGVLDDTSLQDDRRFATYASRLEHFETLSGLVASATRSKSRDEWLRDLDQVGISAGPVNSISEAAEDPALTACHAFASAPMPTENPPIQSTRPIGRFQTTPVGPVRRPPEAGEHTLEVLDELGIAGAPREAVEARWAARRQVR